MKQEVLVNNDKKTVDDKLKRILAEKKKVLFDKKHSNKEEQNSSDIEQLLAKLEQNSETNEYYKYYYENLKSKLDLSSLLNKQH